MEANETKTGAARELVAAVTRLGLILARLAPFQPAIADAIAQL